MEYIELVKSVLSIAQYLIIIFAIPVYRFFRELNKNINQLNETMKRLNNTVRFLEAVVMDIADDKAIARATKKVKALEGKDGITDNI